MAMEAAIITVRFMCLFFVLDVRCSNPSDPIDGRNKTSYVVANHTYYDVVDTRLKLFGGDDSLKKTTKVTVIRRCCVNDDCRVLQHGEKCELPANFTSVHSKILKRPTPSIDNKSSENLKNKPPAGHVKTAVGFNEDKAAQIRFQVLSRSNFFRQKYGVSPLAMDEKINGIAQDWANRLAITGQRRHRPSNAYGENIYFTTELENLGEKAVDSWFEEIGKFNQSDDEPKLFANSAIHHMTQLLWKSSSKLGVGVTKNPNNLYKYIIVANYNPPGNVYGHFKRNLPEMV